MQTPCSSGRAALTLSHQLRGVVLRSHPLESLSICITTLSCLLCVSGMHASVRCGTMPGSLLNKAILLPAVITAVYSRQIYSLQLSRLSDSLRLPLSFEVVSVFLSLPHYVGSSAGSSGSTYSVCSSCSSSPPFSCSIGGPSACEVQSRILLQLDQLEGTYHKGFADPPGLGPRRVRPLCFST